MSYLGLRLIQKVPKFTNRITLNTLHVTNCLLENVVNTMYVICLKTMHKIIEYQCKEFNLGENVRIKYFSFSFRFIILSVFIW